MTEHAPLPQLSDKALALMAREDSGAGTLNSRERLAIDAEMRRVYRMLRAYREAKERRVDRRPTPLRYRDPKVYSHVYDDNGTPIRLGDLQDLP